MNNIWQAPTETHPDGDFIGTYFDLSKIVSIKMEYQWWLDSTSKGHNSFIGVIINGQGLTKIRLTHAESLIEEWNKYNSK